MPHRFGIAFPFATFVGWSLVVALLGSTSLGQARPTPPGPDGRPVSTEATPAPPATPPAATTPAPATATAPATTTSTAPTIAPFTLDQLAARAEAAANAIRRTEADLGDTSAHRVLEQRVRELSAEVTDRLDEGHHLLIATPSIDALRALEREWEGIRRRLADWSKAIELRRAALGRDEANLAELEAAWRRTLEDVRASGLAETDVAARAATISSQLGAARARAAPRSAELRALAALVAAQDVRVADALASVRDAEAGAVGRLLDRDSDPVWTGRLGGAEDVAEGSRNALGRQWTATVAYARRQPWRFFVHAMAVAALALAARRVGWRWGPELQKDRATARSACVFRTPIAAGLLATLPLILWLYPEAPRLLMSMLGALLLVPAVIVLTRLTQRPLRPLLYGLVVLYVAQLVVRVSGSVPALSRAVFLLAMTGGALQAALFLYRSAHHRALPRLLGPFAWGIIRLAVRIAFVVMAAAALANAAGFVGLSRLIGDALLASAFVGVMLDAYVRVARALIAVGLRIRPMSLLRVVQRNRRLLLHRATMILCVGAALWWASITLDVLGVRRPVMDVIGSVLWTQWGVGAVSLSLGGIIAFALAVAASILLSRFVRFLLEEDVYPRVHLARGVPYAISTMLHYAILFVGFLVAVAALGYDMTKFTILAGAFGVGLGFGMQNIVNNFVSGLILLFERPIQIGDVIELDPATIGVVARIGIRASIVRLPSAAEVIVPNGMLIAGRVTNWTLSNRQRGFEVPVSVAAGSNPKAVMAMLTQVARENASIAMEPSPEAYLTEFLPGGGMKFELRVRTERFDDWMRARSELVAAIDSALAAREIQRV